MREILSQLYLAVGTRPTLPSIVDLRRIRYTPITRPYKEAAELSWRITRQEGLGAMSEKGSVDGLLLDVAELWELFLLASVRQALPGLLVEHGTAEGEALYLLTSDADSGRGLGRLKPDILVWNGDKLVAVVDAKYKRLADRYPDRPAGVDRGDLYQLTSYLAGMGADGQVTGMLLYPQDPEQAVMASAERLGPWRMGAGNTVRFARVEVTREGAINELRALLAGLA